MSPKVAVASDDRKSKLLYTPVFLAALRILICFLPHTGYLHPDEFFQSPDVVGKDILHAKTQPVWEFETDRPIRCILLPYLLNSVSFKLASILQTRPSAYSLLVAPRLAYTLLSFVVDFCLYKLCHYYSSKGLPYLPISVIFQTSFVCIGCMTRTFSNTLEVVIYAILLVIVCQTIRPRFKILFVSPSGRSTPVQERVKSSTQLRSSLLIGVVITLGVFNRPTFLNFALVPTIFWIIESLKRNTYDRAITTKLVLVPIAVSGAITAIVISSFDTIYYNGFQTITNLSDHLINFRFESFYTDLQSKWILTPYNFLLYNTNISNLSKYELHPPYTHMLVSIPLAFNILGLLFYRKIINLLLGPGIYQYAISTHRIYAVMFFSILTSTVLFSCVPHQEFRFLLPLIIPLVYIFASSIYSSNKLLTLWLLTNLILVYFYTCVHQAGVVRAVLDLDSKLKAHQLSKTEDFDQVHVIALRCYLVPSYQWNINSNDDRFNFDLLDTFRDFNSSVNLKIGRIVEYAEEYPLSTHRIYIMIPQIYEDDFRKFLNGNYELELINRYSPHFSGEDLGRSISYIKDNGVKNWLKAFGFSLFKFDLNNQRSAVSKDEKL